MPDTDGFLARWSRRKVQTKQGLVAPEGEPAEAAEPAAAALARGPAALAAGAPHAPATTTAAAATTPPATQPAANAAPGAAGTAAPDAPPPAPTLEEAQRLTTADDFSRFVGRNVDPQVKNTALRTLFSDPHFNVMDGLDTYIDDYGKPDPLPPGMLRQMVQSSMLGLFDDEPEDPAAVQATAALPPCQPADNPALPTDAAAQAADPAASEPPTPTLPATPTDEDIALRLQPHDAAGSAGDRAGACQDPGRQH